MKTRNILIAIVCMLAAMSTSAQTSTSYGVKYNDNRNLRFEKSEKAHSEIFLGGRVGGGSESGTSYGADLQLRRQHKLFAYGVQFTTEGNTEVGAMNAAALLGGIRLGGKSVSLDIDVQGGYGQFVETIEQKSSIDSACYKLTSWQPFIGGQARLNISLSKMVALSVYGGYRHAFFGNSEHALSPEGIWKTTAQTQEPNRWYAGLGLSVNLNGGQISGDSCWTASVYGGYGNTGAIAGIKAVHYNRTNATGGTIFGFGTEYSVKEEKAKNEVYALGGWRITPKGSTSPVVFDLYASVGVGQYDNTIKSSTEATLEDGSPRYKMGSKTLDLGANGKLHAGILFGSGSVRGGVEGFVGYYFSAKTNYANEGVQAGYDGNQGKTNGALWGVVATLGISF
jgi:hypothetical protein